MCSRGGWISFLIVAGNGDQACIKFPRRYIVGKPITRDVEVQQPYDAAVLALVKQQYPNTEHFQRHCEIETTPNLLRGFHNKFAGSARVKKCLRSVHKGSFDRNLPDIGDWSSDPKHATIAAKRIRMCRKFYQEHMTIQLHDFPVIREELALLPSYQSKSGPKAIPAATPKSAKQSCSL